MWDTGNIVTCKLGGQWFLPQAAVFFKRSGNPLENSKNCIHDDKDKFM